MAKVPVLAARIFRNVFMEGKHAGMPCFRSDRELDFCTLLCLQWLLVCQIPSDPSLDWAGNYAQMLGQVAKSIQSLACDFLNFLSPSHSLRFTNPLFSCWLKPLPMLGMKFTTERIRTDMPYFIFWLKSRDVTIVIIVHFRDQMSLKKHILYLRPKPWSWMHGMHETWPYAGHPCSTSGLSWKKHACFSVLSHWIRVDFLVALLASLKRLKCAAGYFVYAILLEGWAGNTQDVKWAMFYALTWIHRLTRHEFRYSDPSVYSSFGGMQEQNCIQLSQCAKLPGALKWKITAVKQWMT